jgi:hypothetical protein
VWSQDVNCVQQAGRIQDLLLRIENWLALGVNKLLLVFYCVDLVVQKVGFGLVKHVGN